MTWLFVIVRPSGVKTKPEPEPPGPPFDPSTSILTTDGLTRSTAAVTALEYASSNASSFRD
jgi:hypothetical protein